MATVLAVTLAAVAWPTPASADSVNLIQNPSAETLAAGQPAYWTPASWGTGTTVLKATSDAHTGKIGLNVTTSARTSGDAKWMPDALNVTSGKQYTYSEFYKATASSELDVAYTDATGKVTYAYLASLGPAAAWQQATNTFTVPAGAIMAAVLHILPTVGSLTIDDASLAAAVTSTNLIANPSLETANGTAPAGWQRSGWGTNNASFTYQATGHSGSRSVSVSITTYRDGDAKWYANPVTVTAGQQYTYSDFYSSPVVTRLVAAYTTAYGTSYVELAPAPAAATWAAYTATLTAPTGAISVVVYHLLDKVGTLTLDDVSLSAGAAAPAPPAPLTIANPSVETSANGTAPDGWQHSSWGTNTVAFSYPSDGHTGARSVKTTVASYTDGDAKWYFTPVTGLRDGQSYRFSAWLKSNTQPLVVADLAMADGSHAYRALSTASANPTSWQQYSAVFTAPNGAQSVTVFVLLASVGWVETDDYAIAGYTPVGFNQALVSLTFDDGWSNISTNGLPLLQKYGLPSTQYIITGNIGAPNYMTATQIRAFQTAGSEIGSHTVSHSDLTTLTATQLRSELADSQSTLRQLFGSSVATSFASPYGASNDTAVTAIKQYYASHRSTDVGFNSRDFFNPYNIVVQNIDATTTNAQVAAWIDQAGAQRTWLVLVYHQVENQLAAGDTYAVKTADLDTQLAYLKASGVTVKTLGAALADVTAQR